MNNLTEPNKIETTDKKTREAEQILELLRFNVGLCRTAMISELEKTFNLVNALSNDEKIISSVYRCLQLERGYTEYHVTSIAKEIGYNRTRTKMLIQYLIDEGKIELMTEYNTTFLRPAKNNLNKKMEPKNVKIENKNKREKSVRDEIPKEALDILEGDDNE